MIGNGAYQSVPALPNPPQDAHAIADSLGKLGFSTNLLLDASKSSIEEAIAQLGAVASGADAAVVFYAGHGTEVGGRNILIPVSASIRNATDLEREGVAFDSITAALDGKARTTIIFLDACRDNPFRVSEVAVPGGPNRQASSRSRSLGGGLAAVSSGAGSLIAFATAPGQVALDGNAGHSPFAAALLSHLGSAGVEVRQMLSEVRRDVRQATNGEQTPWDTSSLEQGFYFLSGMAESVSDAIFAEASRLGIALPGAFRSVRFRRDGGPASRLVGAWSSGGNRWFEGTRADAGSMGGMFIGGKASMVLVLAVDAETGRVDMVHAWSNFAGQVSGAGFNRPIATYKNGAIRYTYAGGRRTTFRLNSDNELDGQVEAAKITLTRFE